MRIVIFSKRGNVRGRFRLVQGEKLSARLQKWCRAQPRPMPFEDALVAHLEGLYAFALRLLVGRRDFAEDLVQETCLRAFRAYENVRSPEKIKTWFFTILFNTYINEFHRPSLRQPIIDVELSESLLSLAHARTVPTPEEKLFEGLLDSEIQEALDNLPVEFQMVVWLADVEDLSYVEIGEIIHCPPGTVASRLYRGHSLLRERLRDYARRRGLIKE